MMTLQIEVGQREDEVLQMQHIPRCMHARGHYSQEPAIVFNDAQTVRLYAVLGHLNRLLKKNLGGSVGHAMRTILC